MAYHREAPALQAVHPTRREADLLCAYATTFIPAPADEVYNYLIRFEQFPAYDEKATALKVLGIDEQGRTEIEISGRFGLVPYVAHFKATIVPGKGYRTEMVSGSFIWARGQFWVRAMDGGCEVTHLEEYQLGWGWLGNVVESAWRPYVQATVDREVLTLKQLIVDGHHRTVQPVEAVAVPV